MDNGDANNTLIQDGGKRKCSKSKVIKAKRSGKGKGGCGSCGSAATGGKSKKSKAISKKDCVKKPKRKLSPYNIFIKSAYARLKKLHPNDSAPQIMKKAAVEWNSKK